MKPLASKHLYLIDFMGTGESSAAESLGPLLGRDNYDLDREIERESKMTVARIFAEEGEDGFRHRETRALQTLVTRTPAVVALGGGILLRDANRDLIKRTGMAVLLIASWETIWNRVQHSKDRPLLQGVTGLKDGGEKNCHVGFVEKSRSLFEERAGHYSSAADWSIDTTSLTVNEVAVKIADWWNRTTR